jgi:mannose-1-phosphate guanylyltransferase
LGYTKFGPLFEKRDNTEVYQFAGHTEKPPREVAEQYLADGSYLWHANYYMWTPRKFMAAFENYAPETAAILRKIQTVRTDDIRDLYSQLPKKSFDYLITEKMNPESVLVIKGDFGWSDIGAWDTLFDRLSENGGNVVKGNGVLIDTNGSLVYAPVGKTVAVLGMNDVVVVDTPDALLVCPKNQAQRVKEIIVKLQEAGQQDLL